MKSLRNALRFNAATCLGFGLLFLAVPALVANFLGEVPEIALRVIGGALIFNGLHLIHASRREKIPALEVYYFASGDIIWFVASLGVLASGTFITTAQGSQVTLTVAFMVVFIGLGQLWAHADFAESGIPVDGDRNRDWYLPVDLTRGRAIATSWRGIKSWVKIWLFALNIAFLLVLFWWPDTFAKITIAAFVAAGPLLFAIMIVQRGLTRLLGLGHLIVWLPLLGYFWLRLTGVSAGPQIALAADPLFFAYVSLLTVMIVTCLAFDLYDLARWMGGRRGRLGSPSERYDNG